MMSSSERVRKLRKRRQEEKNRKEYAEFLMTTPFSSGTTDAEKMYAFTLIKAILKEKKKRIGISIKNKRYRLKKKLNVRDPPFQMEQDVLSDEGSALGLDSELNEITVEVDPTFADYSTIVPDCDDRQRRWNGTFAPIKVRDSGSLTALQREVLTSSSLTGNSGSILLEIDSPEAKQRIIESCLKKPNLTADDVVAYVREYLNQSKPRDESMSTHLEDGSPAPKRTKKLSFNAPLKIEEELTLEDYGDTNDNMEFETEKEHENIAAIKGENNREVQAFPHKAEGPFETIICGTSDVQIKQEIFEDERENPTEELTSWVAEGTENRLASTTNITPNIATSQDQMAPKRTKETPKTTKCLQHSNSLLTSSGMQKCRVCKEPFSSLSELVEHCILHHSDSSSKFLPASEPKFTPTAVPEIPQFIPATTPGNNVCSNPVTKATSTSGFARAKCIPEYNSTTTTEPVVGNISSGTTLPNPTAPNWIPPYISACDVLDGIFVSLRTIPFENRKATIDKIVEFVSYMSKGDIDPSAISFVITKK